VHQQIWGNRIAKEQLYIATKNTFTNGATTKAWPDMTDALHTFPTCAEFTAFAEAAGQFVDAVLAAKLAALVAGGTWTAPSNAYTIP
jgi:hypothetical protein